MSCCICKLVRSCHRSILKDKILLVNMVHFHLSLSRCGTGSLETCTHNSIAQKYYAFKTCSIPTPILIPKSTLY